MERSVICVLTISPHTRPCVERRLVIGRPSIDIHRTGWDDVKAGVGEGRLDGICGRPHF